MRYSASALLLVRQVLVRSRTKPLTNIRRYEKVLFTRITDAVPTPIRQGTTLWYCGREENDADEWVRRVMHVMYRGVVSKVKVDN